MFVGRPSRGALKGRRKRGFRRFTAPGVNAWAREKRPSRRKQLLALRSAQCLGGEVPTRSGSGRGRLDAPAASAPRKRSAPEKGPRVGHRHRRSKPWRRARGRKGPWPSASRWWKGDGGHRGEVGRTDRRARTCNPARPAAVALRTVGPAAGRLGLCPAARVTRGGPGLTVGARAARADLWGLPFFAAAPGRGEGLQGDQHGG